MALSALALVVCSMWPWVRQSASAIPEGSSLGWAADARLIVWIVTWVAHALASAPSRLFDANIFHPIPRMLTGSESLLSAVAVTGPIYAVTGNPVLAANLAAIGTYWLALVVTYALMRTLDLPIVAAAVASAAFTLGPLQVPADLHVLQYPNWLLAGTLLVAVRAEHTRRYRWVLPVVTLAVFGSYYVAAMTAAVLACEVIIVWCTCGRAAALRLVAASAPAFALLAVFSLAYLRGPVSTPSAAAFDMSIAAARVFWGAILDPWSIEPGLGWGTMLLAGAGLLLPLVRGRRPDVRWWRWFALTVVGASLAAPYVVRMGAFDVPMPSALLAATPLRAQHRWILVAHLGLAGFVAEGTAILARWVGHRRHRLPVGVLLGAALLAFVWVPRARSLVRPRFATLPVGEGVPSVYRWLAAHASGPLFEPPGPSAANWLPQADAMVHSIYHWLPLLNGHTGFPPWQYQAVVPELNRLPDREALQAVVDLTGLRWVLVRNERVPPSYRAAWEAFARANRAVERVDHGGPDLLLRVTLEPRRDWAAALARGWPAPGKTALGTPLATLDEADVRGRVVALVPPRLPRGTARSTARVAITNTGAQTWPALVAPRARDAGVVRLVVRWTAPDGALVSESFRPIPRDVAPGDTVRFRGDFPVPAGEGTYHLDIGVTQRGGAVMRGVAGARLTIVVD